jgi:hypothetical protein
MGRPVVCHARGGTIDVRHGHQRNSNTEGRQMGRRQLSIRGVLVAISAVLLFTTNVAALEVGQKAPEFTLTAPDGKPVKLTELTAKGPVAIYTFVQAFTAT